MAKKKIIVVDPSTFEGLISDCPFADQDNYCSILCGHSARQCGILDDRTSCPLNVGAVEVSLATYHRRPEAVEAMTAGSGCTGIPDCKWYPSSCDDCSGELYEPKVSDGNIPPIDAHGGGLVNNFGRKAEERGG